MAGPLSHPLSATKLRNAIRRRAHSADNLDIAIKNTRINGQLRGCSGFITNSDTGAIAYVNVEFDPDLDQFRGYGDSDLRALYRTAESTSDYTGGRNQFSRELDDLPDDVLELIT